jgi:hypothetical protein
MVAPPRQRVQEASVRVIAAIGVILLTLGGCGGARETPATPGPAPQAAALRCEPWPAGNQPPSGARLLQSTDQSLPGTASGFGAPVSVIVGEACVTLPAGETAAGLYCGASELARPPAPCQLGEECAIGSIMVTDLFQYAQAGGTATCATFENWARTGSRGIYLWAKTR